jgi:hypothetical protein
MMVPGGDGACWGRNPGGSVLAVRALSQTGPQQGLHPNAHCVPPKRDFSRRSPSQGIKSNGRRSRGHGARSRGPADPAKVTDTTVRESNRHNRPRGPRPRARPRHPGWRKEAIRR